MGSVVICKEAIIKERNRGIRNLNYGLDRYFLSSGEGTRNVITTAGILDVRRIVLMDR